MDGNALLLLAAALFFGFMATEGTVEYLLGTLFERLTGKKDDAGNPTYPLRPYSWTLMYASVAVGIFLAFHYALDIPSVVLGLPASPVGVILTGIVIGRGANFVSDVWSRFLGKGSS